MTITELIQRLNDDIERAQAERRTHTDIVTTVRDACHRDNRDPSADEAARVNTAAAAVRAADARVDSLRARREQLEDEQRRDNAVDALQREVHPAPGRITMTERTPAGSSTSGAGQWVRAADGRPASVARGQAFERHPVVTEHAARMAGQDAAVVGQHGTFGQLVRAMSTSSGSALVPTVWAADVIDRARNKAAVLKAGAQVVPMDAKVVQIGRLTVDPTAAFRTEGSTVTASDPTFDNVTLTATTMSALVVGSLEWFQDADGVDEIVGDAIAAAIANQVDLVALYGSIVAGAGSISLATPPNPRGILATLNAVASTSVLGGAAGGTTQTATSFYNEVLDTAMTPTDYNETPNALIWNSKLARMYAKAYDTTGQPLRVPSALDGVEKFVSNQIPSYTQGAMTDVATDLFAGDFTQLIVGQRLGLTIQTLTERYAELGQVGIVAHWRGDIGVARPRAFSVYKALKGA